MDRRVTGLALAGVIAAGGLGLGAAAMAPALASQTGPSATSTDSTETAADLAEDPPGHGAGGPGHDAGGPGHDAGGPGHGPGGRLLDLTVAADALGISPEELRTGLQEGRSPAEVATAEGVATEDLVAALVEAAQTRLAELVGAGELTQEQADERIGRLQERVQSFVDRSGGTGRSGHGGQGGGAAG